ncbi:MAG: Fe-S cluster assembly protein SufD [Anaerolineae bacterium]|nr:Fe-S cluster assembly protein SufD [Anaerolineae bacterium]
MAQTRTSTFPLTRDDVIALSERLGEPEWMREKRLAAWELAEATAMPTTSDEPWRRTSIARLKWNQMFHLQAPNGVSISDVPDALYRPLIGEEQGGLLVFVNGKLVKRELNPALAAQGVIFTDMASALHDHAALVQKHFMNEAVPVGTDKFSALHGAMWTHGTFLYVPANVHVELPLHSVEYAPGHMTTATHILAILEPGASATYLHESASPETDDLSLHLGAIELLVRQDADLRFVRLQNWDQGLYNFEHQRGRIGRGGRLDWVAGEMGTRLSKVFTTLELDEDDAWGRISGLYFYNNQQHLDIDTQQNHHALRNTSDLLYKGALKDESRSVWQGMILVDPGAQQTDGYQVNRNLLLDRTARADSIPGLEIQADDVRCTHAAATGKVDETEIFYLMSRGIPRAEATRLIVKGFFDPVMQRIPFEEVRERLDQLVERKLLG